MMKCFQRSSTIFFFWIRRSFFWFYWKQRDELCFQIRLEPIFVNCAKPSKGEEQSINLCDANLRKKKNWGSPNVLENHITILSDDFQEILEEIPWKINIPIQMYGQSGNSKKRSFHFYKLVQEGAITIFHYDSSSNTQISIKPSVP